MKRLCEGVEAGEFLVTAECPPPKGTDLARVTATARSLLGKVHGLNVTDNQAAIMRASSLAISKYLLDLGHDPIFQITGRDRNRLAAQSDLLGAHILGIKNVLCLTGDYVTVGDHKEAKPVFDLESVHLLQVVAQLNGGHDMVGNALNAPTSLFPGATITPETNPLEPILVKFQQKVMAGARFFQTQATYDPERFARFMEFARKFDVKILAGILLLRSAKMARYVTANIPGIRVPAPIIAELEGAGKEGAIEKGIEIAVRTIKEVSGICDGVHIMAIGAEDKMQVILNRAGLWRE